VFVIVSVSHAAIAGVAVIGTTLAIFIMHSHHFLLGLFVLWLVYVVVKSGILSARYRQNTAYYDSVLFGSQDPVFQGTVREI
jgi:hypothetical protein